MKYLITGAAGFIGFHLTRRLLDEGCEIVGIDNLNSYYDVSLKESRLEILRKNENFRFVQMDISDCDAVKELFAIHKFNRIYHLAAQAGVRYSLENPHVYIKSNIVGFVNILEECRKEYFSLPQIEMKEDGNPSFFHLIYASSSSVYGLNTKMPFSVGDRVDHPVSLYATTKRTNELMAYTYSHLYGIPTTGLRLFTVYGPWGRPDMALFKFTKSILMNEAIDVYNDGNMKRDFTYIDDIIEGVVRIADRAPAPSTSQSSLDLHHGSIAPYALYNIGNSKPVSMMDFISVIEATLGKRARINYHPMQPGEVLETYADINKFEDAVGFRPSTDMQTGIRKFVEWYRNYYCSSASELEGRR